jgi:hypothetical protein
LLIIVIAQMAVLRAIDCAGCWGDVAGDRIFGCWRARGEI